MVCDLDVVEAALREAVGELQGKDLDPIRPPDAEAVTVEILARWFHARLGGAIRAAGGETLAVRRLGVADGVRRLSARGVDELRIGGASPPGKERRSGMNDSHLVLPLITLGDPRQLSGGYLYHLRMSDAAPAHQARIIFLSFPEWSFPLAAIRGGAMLRRSEELRASAVLVDSIAAALAAPALARWRHRVPVIAVLHQPPGGIDHGVVRATAQAPLDRLALRRADLLIAASDHLVDQLVEAGFAGREFESFPRTGRGFSSRGRCAGPP